MGLCVFLQGHPWVCTGTKPNVVPAISEPKSYHSKNDKNTIQTVFHQD